MTPTREFWVAVRQALLMLVDALERELGISPRTAELRKDRKMPWPEPKPPVKGDTVRWEH